MISAIFRKMELRHVRYFVAVAEDLSFTKAAQKLRLAQPSLKRQVRKLEDEIGVRLLDRSNNRVALTEQGRRFLFDSKKILAASPYSQADQRRRLILPEKWKNAVHLHPEIETPRQEPAAFIRTNGIKVLNVAGPRLSVEPRITEFVLAALKAANLPE